MNHARLLAVVLLALAGCAERDEIPDEGLMVTGADGIAAVGDLDGDGWGDHVAWFTSDQVSGGDLYLDLHVMVYLQGMPLGESWILADDGERVDEHLASSAIYLGDRREGAFAVVAAGDLDDDGCAEMAIGACTSSQFQDACSQSRVVVFPGMESWPDEVFEQTVLGAVDLEDLDLIDAVGEVSDDGIDDLLLRFGTGGDFLLLGRSDGWTEDLFGDLENITPIPGRADAVGDLDGDGVDDVVTVDDDDVVRVVLGSADWSDPPALQAAEFSAAPYGDVRPLRVGDLDGDGIDDLLLVAEEGPDGTCDGGRGGVLVVRGRSDGWAEVDNGDIDLAYAMPCDVDPERFDARGGGDVDGDGRGDLLISEPLAEPGDVVARVGLLLGDDLAGGDAEPSWTQDYSVVLEPRFVGQVDGDEYDDIAVSLEGLGTWIYPGRVF
jgi:hypothetical protein